MIHLVYYVILAINCFKLVKESFFFEWAVSPRACHSTHYEPTFTLQPLHIAIGGKQCEEIKVLPYMVIGDPQLTGLVG